MTDWPKALEEMKKDEPQLYRDLRDQDKPFTHALRTELVRLLKQRPRKTQTQNENIDEWRTNPAVIRETVEVAKRFLDEHPEEKKKLLGNSRITLKGKSMTLKWEPRGTYGGVRRVLLSPPSSSPLSSPSSTSPSSPLHPKEPDTKKQESHTPKLQARLQVLEAEPKPRKSRPRVVIILQGRPPGSPHMGMGRTITIMSTRNPRNSFKYGMIQKRDFGIRVIDIICHKRTVGVPFKAKKGGSNPIYAKKTGVKSHFCFEVIER